MSDASEHAVEINPSARYESVKLKDEISEGSTTEDYATCTDNSKRATLSKVLCNTTDSKGIFKTTQAIKTAKKITGSKTIRISGKSFFCL